MANFYTEIPTQTSAYFGGASQSRFSPGAARDAGGEVEAFISRCRQDEDRNFRYKYGGNREMDPATVATFLNMLTDVNSRCRAMEDQLTGLQKHAQRVTSQLDSIVSHQGRHASSSSSSSSSSASISTGAYTMKAIRKLQWKIFDLQRENEALRAVLEMQRKGEDEAENDQVERQDNYGTTTQSTEGSSWARLGLKPQTSQKTPGTNSAQSVPKQEAPTESASTASESDTRVVHLVNSEDGVINSEEHLHHRMDQQVDSEFNHKQINVHVQTRKATANGFHPKCKHPQTPQADSGFNMESTSGYLNELKSEAPKESPSTPSRYPYTKWTSAGRNKSRSGHQPPGRQAWRWTSHQPRLFPQVSTKMSTKLGNEPGPEPRNQSTPANPSWRDVQEKKVHLGQTDDEAASVNANSADQRSDLCKEVFSDWDWDRNPCSREPADDMILEEFNLYATPEDIRLVQGTLELLSSIDNLEYTRYGKE